LDKSVSKSTSKGNLEKLTIIGEQILTLMQTFNYIPIINNKQLINEWNLRSNRNVIIQICADMML